MKVKLLVDLTSYHPSFKKDAIGESDIRDYVPPDKPWRRWVNVVIDGKTLPVGVDGVECLDEKYIRMKQLEEEIRQEEILNKLKQAEKVFYLVGVRGGIKGIRIKNKNENSYDWLADKNGTPEILQLCKDNGIKYAEITEDDFYKLPRL